MTSTFHTRVGEEGEWPAPPEHWSFSTLVEVESCALRYALRNATYTGAGHDGVGYPDKVADAALVGTVIHAAVEEILRALRRVQDPSDAASALPVLRELGGYTKVVERCIEVAEERLASNPRMQPRVARAAANLRRRTPDIRSTVQALVARLPASRPHAAAGHEPRPTSGVPRQRGPFGPGRHPEARLRSDDRRFKGQIDLLDVGDDSANIIDFKSWQPDAHHSEQLILYGLLWLLDRIANPDGLHVGAMTVAYAGHDAVVTHPASWSDVETELERRIDEADQAISATPTPQLSPSCTTCTVRHMCDAYWLSQFPLAEASRFVDVEAQVLARNGATSWRVRLPRSAEDALLRTTSEDVVLAEARTVRLLDVACERQLADDGASAVVILTAVASTEIFEVKAD